MIQTKEPRWTDRIVLLKQRVRGQHSERLYVQRKEIFERVFLEHASDDPVIRMARGLAAFLREKDLILYEDDLLAGCQQRYDFSLPTMGKPAPWDAEWRPSGNGNSSESELLGEFQKGLRMGLFGTAMGGHVIGGYDRVLHKGFGSLAHAARTRLDKGGRVGQEFARASLIVCEAATEYVLRYTARAREMTEEATNEEYADQLQRIADACQWVAVHPPRSFFEAVQLLWLTHELITCEQGSGSLSLGRLDQYLFPYYEKDLAAGMLTRPEAGELIEALWVKFNGLSGGYQHVVLGGCGSGGTYVANDLSSLCLQATGNLKMDQPLLSVRWHPDMPDGFWQEIQDLIQIGLGFPALFNDEVAIAAKRRLGIGPEDAVNYGVVGCVELSIPGKEFSQTEMLRINWAKVLDLMLHGGVCPVTGEVVSLKRKRALESITSFEDFYQWYREELAHYVDLGIRSINIWDREFTNHRPYPFLSSTMAGCLEQGCDVTAGGTTYNLSSVNGGGMANAVDSLAAIKRMVYQERKVSLPELAETLRNDFEGAEILREALVSRCPRYGTDEDEIDDFMKALVDGFCGYVESYRNPRGGRFQTGLYTVNWHTTLGRLTGSLPDGHRCGLALASGFSPSQGADTRGPTAVIQSSTKCNHRLLGNGMVLDLKFSPSFFTDRTRTQAFRHLVETYFQMGGMEIQFNVIDRDTLMAAQQSPTAYRDLLVRVSGFSAYFVNLDKLTQDEIIARTEHCEI